MEGASQISGQEERERERERLNDTKVGRTFRFEGEVYEVRKSRDKDEFILIPHPRHGEQMMRRVYVEGDKVKKQGEVLTGTGGVHIGSSFKTNPDWPDAPFGGGW